MGSGTVAVEKYLVTEVVISRTRGKWREALHACREADDATRRIHLRRTWGQRTRHSAGRSGGVGKGRKVINDSVLSKSRDSVTAKLLVGSEFSHWWGPRMLFLTRNIAHVNSRFLRVHVPTVGSPQRPQKSTRTHSVNPDAWIWTMSDDLPH